MATTNTNLSSSIWSVADLLRRDFKQSDQAFTKPGVVRSLYEPTAGTGDILQERRTALIATAVTGQIDIREFA